MQWIYYNMAQNVERAKTHVTHTSCCSDKRGCNCNETQNKSSSPCTEKSHPRNLWPAPVTVKHFFKEDASPASESSSSPTRYGLPRRPDSIFGNRDRMAHCERLTILERTFQSPLEQKFQPLLAFFEMVWVDWPALEVSDEVGQQMFGGLPCVLRPAIVLPLDEELCMVAAQPFRNAFHLKSSHLTGLRGGPVFLPEHCIGIAFHAQCVETNWMSSALRHISFDDCQWTDWARPNSWFY